MPHGHSRPAVIAKPDLVVPASAADVEAGIRKDISAGVWKPGDELPSTEDLTRHYNSSSFCVRVAVRRLAADRVLIQQGPRRSVLIGGPGVVGLATARDVEHRLREDIRAGVWKPGTTLPTQRALADRYHSSSFCVRIAVGRLAQEGLLIRPPKGWRPVIKPDYKRRI